MDPEMCQAIQAATKLGVEFFQEQGDRKRKNTSLTKEIVKDCEDRLARLRQDHPQLSPKQYDSLVRFVDGLRKQL